MSVYFCHIYVGCLTRIFFTTSTRYKNYKQQENANIISFRIHFTLEVVGAQIMKINFVRKIPSETVKD